jgi:hypothetical protein
MSGPSDDNYGYRHQHIKDSGDLYSTGKYTGGVSFTDWSEYTIEQMMATMSQLHDGQYTAAALQWRMIAGQLTELRGSLTGAADEMHPQWNPAASKAAAVFFDRIGASSWSMDRWITTATDNAATLERMADDLAKKRKELQTVYQTFLGEWNSNVNKANYYNTPEGTAEIMKLGVASAAGGGMPNVSVSDWQRPYLKAANAARDKYTEKARDVMRNLGQLYRTNSVQLLESDTFQGPTTAVNPLAALGQRIQTGAGGGLPGGGNAKARLHAAEQQQLAVQRKLAAQREIANLQRRAQQQELTARQNLAQQKLAAEQKLAAQRDLAARQQAAAEAQKLAAQQELAQQRSATEQMLAQRLAAQESALQQLAGQQQLALRQLTAQRLEAQQRQAQELALQQRLSTLPDRLAAEQQEAQARLLAEQEAQQAMVRQSLPTGPAVNLPPTSRAAGLNLSPGGAGEAGSLGTPRALPSGGIPGGAPGGLPGGAPGGLGAGGAGMRPGNGGFGAAGPRGELRGRLGGSPGPGSAGALPPGGGQPLSGRRGASESTSATGRSAPSTVRPEREDYLADVPTAGPQPITRLGADGFSAATPPPPSLTSRGSKQSGPTGRGTGSSSTRPGQRSADLSGRRRSARRSDPLDEDAVLVDQPIPTDLNGRNGLPAVNLDEPIEVVTALTARFGAPGGAASTRPPEVQVRPDPQATPGTAAKADAELDPEEELWTPVRSSSDTQGDDQSDGTRRRVTGAG